MARPDYQGGSIVNLMSSLVLAMGGEETLYRPLAEVPPRAIRDSRNVVLLVVDGLGYDYLKRHQESEVLRGCLQSGITSVFPPTTATAITTFLTGTAPQQHGLTGWFMHFRELGDIVAVLPFLSRHGGGQPGGQGLDLAAFLGHTPIFDRIRVRSHCVVPRSIASSSFNRAHTGRAEVHAFSTLSECFSVTASLIRRGGEERQYIYVYWPELDAKAHRYGIASPEVWDHYRELDDLCGRFLAFLAGSDTTLLVTADHGFVDAGPSTRLQLEDYPTIAESLVMPLSGEKRLAYCYVHPEKVKQFETAVQNELAGVAELYRSRDLLEAGYYGLGAPHPRLADRIGHYTLAMTGNYTIQDRVPGEEAHAYVGHHGGMSEEELIVPLCVAQV